MNATREQKMEWYKADIEKKFRALHAHLTMAQGVSEELGFTVEVDMKEFPNAETMRSQSQAMNVILAVDLQLVKLMAKVERAAKLAGVNTSIVEE